MNPGKSLFLGDTSREVSALIETLHRTGQRLEELTAGEVDTVADREGRTFLLQRAQEHLRKTDAARQMAILNALPAQIALLDTEGCIISVNETWRQFAGTSAMYRPGHTPGLNYLDICDRATGEDAVDAQRAGAGIRSVLSGHAKTFSLVYPCHSPTEKRWFLMTVTPLADDARSGAVVMHLNISERMRAENETLRLTKAMDATVDAIYIVDRASMRFVYLNDAACRMREQTREALLALGPAGMQSIPRAELERTYDSIIASGKPPAPVEIRRQRKDGAEIWVELRRHAQRSADGWLIVTLVRDITASKQAFDELRQSEGLKRAMLESSLDCVVAVDHEGIIVEFNIAAEVTFGLPSEEAIGKSMVELIVPPRFREALRRGFADYLATGHGPILGKRMELSALRADGSEFPIELAIAAIGGSAKPLFTSFIRDISVQQANQAQLRESEARFRSLTHLSADWFWEQDEQYRFISFSGGAREHAWGSDQSLPVGLRRWELARTTPLSASWHQHKALLEARLPFRNFEYRRVREDGTVMYVSASGEPVFDAGGRFSGYRGVASDITERKQAVQVLRESERRFSTLLGSMELASVMLDCDARITYCNEFLLRLTGWQHEEVIGRDWFETFMPAELGDMRPVFKALLANLPEAWHRDQEIYTRSKERRLIRWNNSVLRSPSGEVIGTASIGEDITERVRAERALRMSEMEQRAIAEQLESERSRLVAAQRVAKVGSWETDLVTLSVIWSLETHRIFETDPATFRPTHPRFLDFVHPDDRAGVEEAFVQSLGRHTDDEFIEHRILLPDRRIKFVEERWRVSFDGQDRPGQAVGTCQDVTARKRIFDELRESDRRFSDMLANVELISIMIDTQSRIVYCNDYFLTLTGWQREELLGAKFVDLIIPPDLANEVQEVHLSMLADLPAARHHENEILTRSGERHLIRWSNSALRSPTGEVIGTASIGEDISERKRAEGEILRLNAHLERSIEERTAALQAANQELEAFDYSVSHDLKAPIRHVEGFSKILIEEYADKLDSRGRDYLQRMQSAGQRMGQLVDDLLALSLISRGELSRQDIDLSALSILVFDNLQRAEPGRDVEFVVTPGLMANADRGLLRIVLENLIGNARKFTADRLGATIQFGNTVVDGGPVFFVRDNGAGFDAAYADKLFAPFQRLHAQSEFSGTGIGLATVRRIITRHGGRVWAAGAIKQGATVYFTLPA